MHIIHASVEEDDSDDDVDGNDDAVGVDDLEHGQLVEVDGQVYRVLIESDEGEDEEDEEQEDEEDEDDEDGEVEVEEVRCFHMCQPTCKIIGEDCTWSYAVHHVICSTDIMLMRRTGHPVVQGMSGLLLVGFLGMCSKPSI